MALDQLAYDEPQPLAVGDPNAKYNTYRNPLIERYASKEMTWIWSDQRKFAMWRRLWLALAESEREMGLDQITDEALAQMRAHLDDIDFKRANIHEKRLKHDVMAHAETF